MRMDKMTSKFQLALADAQSLAVGRDHQFIEPVHLMIALLDQEGGSVRHLLAQADVNVNLLRSQLGELLEKLPQVQGAAGDVHVSNDLGRLLNVTDKLAQQRKDAYISSELFLKIWSSRPSTSCAVASRWMIPTRKTSARRWRNTPST
jgi:ATP-dependent Clp protease ATP-binding subunit ClpB